MRSLHPTRHGPATEPGTARGESLSHTDGRPWDTPHVDRQASPASRLEIADAAPLFTRPRSILADAGVFEENVFGVLPERDLTFLQVR